MVGESKGSQPDARLGSVATLNSYVPEAFSGASANLRFAPRQFTGNGIQSATDESPSRAMTVRRPRQADTLGSIENAGAAPAHPQRKGRPVAHCGHIMSDFESGHSKSYEPQPPLRRAALIEVPG